MGINECSEVLSEVEGRGGMRIKRGDKERERGGLFELKYGNIKLEFYLKRKRI